MKKAVIGIVVLIIVVGGVLVATHKSGSNSPMSSTDKKSSSAASSNSTAVSTDQVKIDNFAFSPANITVKQGTKVTWTNNDSVAHTVRETDGKAGPKSDNLNTGNSYSFVFSAAGTYKYICSIHPDMMGTVTVTQ